MIPQFDKNAHEKEIDSALGAANQKIKKQEEALKSMMFQGYDNIGADLFNNSSKMKRQRSSGRWF